MLLEANNTSFNKFKTHFMKKKPEDSQGVTKVTKNLKIQLCLGLSGKPTTKETQQ